MTAIQNPIAGSSADQPVARIGQIIRSVRRVVIHLASGFPLRDTFATVLRHLRDWRWQPACTP